VTAIQLVTLNPAEYFGLKYKGAVAPGYRADIVVFDDLEGFRVDSVYKDGILLKDSTGRVHFPVQDKEDIVKTSTLNMQPVTARDLSIPHPGGQARIIETIPGQILTRMVIEEPKSENGFLVSDLESDILKMCVAERHEASGRVGVGLVRGFGLKRGAMASSVAHDSHNVIAVGADDEDMVAAVEAVRIMGGGLAVAYGKEIREKVPLEIGGLMSIQPVSNFVRQLKSIKEAAIQLGCLSEEPFMALSFLALPVIPDLRLTDRGLVDVNKFNIIPLFLDQG
jgi:adenine deaminase